MFFLFLFCGKLHKGACILTAVSYSTLLCNRSKAVGDTVTCLFCSNQGRSVNTATLVLHSLKTKTTVWLVPSNDDISPPVWILIHFQRHSRQVVLSFVPFHIRSRLKSLSCAEIDLEMFRNYLHLWKYSLHIFCTCCTYGVYLLWFAGLFSSTNVGPYLVVLLYKVWLCYGNK